MTYRNGATTASSIVNRAIRRTVLGGVGLAVILGVAAPANASVPAPVKAATPAAATISAASNSNPAHVKIKAAAKTPVVVKVKAPSVHDLMPVGVHAHQSYVPTNASQRANAEAIINTGVAKHLPPRAWVIAVATSLQETKLHNYGNLGSRNDHDSLGLFQQRPSSGWGSPKQVTNPAHAAGAFYSALTHVRHYNTLPLTVAAQKVQVSAFGDRYAQWEKEAANLVLAHFHTGPMAAH